MSGTTKMQHTEILKLLEPGALLGGALFRSMLTQSEGRLQLPAGLRLGPYALRSELGRGGMGVVYLAERVDGEFQQQVAIKCTTQAGNEAHLTLFRHERQLLSELKHPHIARFLDAGSTELSTADLTGDAAKNEYAKKTTALLWFAMEYIEGQHFDAYLAQSRPSLDVRLALIQQLASALSAAHARLLVHRDVKPSNVLVDRDGVAKLLDFGIAGFSDGTPAAAYTPASASPEQLALAPSGPASDQYQLGSLLKLALSDGSTTGETRTRTVVPSAHDPTVLQLSREQPDNRKSRILPKGQRGEELQAIVAKACAASPDARYGSIADLSSDLSRWQSHLPVHALGSGLAYSLRCALRRHPWVSAASVSLSTLAIASLIWFNTQLQSERDFARAQAERANATKDYLLSLFQDGDPTRGTDPNLTARQLIESGIVRIQNDQSLSPAVRQELIELMVDIQLRLGESSTAQRLLSGVDLKRIDASKAQMWRARVAAIEGKPAIAHAALVAQYAAHPSALVAIMLARAELDIGETKRAEQRLLELLANPNLKPALRSSALTNLAVLQMRTARPLEAIESNQLAVDQAKLAKPAVSPVPAYINMALAEIDLARFDSALEHLQRGEEWLVTYPNQRNQFLILQNRGMALFRKGEIAQAEQVWRALLKQSEQGVNPGIEAATVHNLAAIADKVDDAVLAIELSERASRLRLQLGDPVAALSSQINIAAKLSTLGLHAQAIETSARAMSEAQKLSRPDLASRAELQNALSHCHLVPLECGGRMQAVTEQFIVQNNVVKALEAIERLACTGYLLGQSSEAQTRAEALAAQLERTLGDNPKALETLQEKKAWIEALQPFKNGPGAATQAKDWKVLEALAGNGAVRRLVLVRLLLNDNQTQAAARLISSLSVQREDYWHLKTLVASRQGQSAEASSTLAEMQQLQARALKALQP